ncbi:hypothetical protein DH2020_039281 [Rehmannia glutinosa]|uniref:Uncharacterized protein n=1 Tax=Rehmannia glutinosa TaxID=99300 RepID=A0ABR0UW98_REHGL
MATRCEILCEILLAILIPPLSVFASAMAAAPSSSSSVILTILGYVPGIISTPFYAIVFIDHDRFRKVIISSPSTTSTPFFLVVLSFLCGIVI